MKKIILSLVLVLFCIVAQSQVKSLHPKATLKIPAIDLTKIPEHQAQISKIYENNQKPSKKQIDFEDLLAEDAVLGHFYSSACSWYCGGIIDTVKASSYLKPAGKITYEGYNTHDFNILSAWVEGVPGHGIGEYVTYFFPGYCPRITEIQILNGYVKTAKAWKENARVKKLQMYYMGTPYAIINLKDSRDLQVFDLGEALGPHNQNAPQWTIKFEILEVYPGTKYEDTAITEIFFDGIDVH